MLLLILSTLLKIVFVLVIIGTYAPVLVWAERRQSSMMQDRVGPVRAGIPLPPKIAELIRGPVTWGAWGVAALGGVVAFAAIVLSFFASPVPDPESIVPLTPGALQGIAAIAAILGIVHVGAAKFVGGAVDKRGHLTAYGLLHSFADVVKMVWKEDFIPPNADKFLHSAAPIIALVPAFAIFAVIPFGPDLLWGPEGDAFRWLFTVVPDGAAVEGTRIPLQIANLNVGILYIFAVAGTGIVGAAIAGYSSDNKYSLLGGIRAGSQMVSYEVTLGATLVGAFMVFGSLRLEEMVAWQQANVWGFIVQPLGLILFFFAAIAEMKRIPFDAPEGESEIVAGYFLEYSGLKFGMFMTGEFVEHVTSGAIIATIFFGGYDVPFLHADGFHFAFIGYDILLPHIVVVLIGVLSFMVKVAIMCFLFLQVRWTLPRFRYDQTMQLCWKILLPLSLANILLTGAVILILS